MHNAATTMCYAFSDYLGLYMEIRLLQVWRNNQALSGTPEQTQICLLKCEVLHNRSVESGCRRGRVVPQHLQKWAIVEENQGELCCDPSQLSMILNPYLANQGDIRFSTALPSVSLLLLLLLYRC